MKFKDELSKRERITTYLCVAIGITYLLGWVKMITPFIRNTIIYCLALPMIILLTINSRKKSKLIFIFCIVASVLITLAAVISVYLLIVNH